MGDISAVSGVSGGTGVDTVCSIMARSTVAAAAAPNQAGLEVQSRFLASGCSWLEISIHISSAEPGHSLFSFKTCSILCSKASIPATSFQGFNLLLQPLSGNIKPRLDCGLRYA